MESIRLVEARHTPAKADDTKETKVAPLTSLFGGAELPNQTKSGSSGTTAEAITASTTSLFGTAGGGIVGASSGTASASASDAKASSGTFMFGGSSAPAAASTSSSTPFAF